MFDFIGYPAIAYGLFINRTLQPRASKHTIVPPPLDFSAKCASLRERGFPFSPLATRFACVFFDSLRTTASTVGSECATSDGRGWPELGRARLKHGRVGLERGRECLEHGDFPGNRRPWISDANI